MGKIRKTDILNTGLTQGVGLLTGLLSGRKKSKEMQEILYVMKEFVTMVHHDLAEIHVKLDALKRDWNVWLNQDENMGKE